MDDYLLLFIIIDIFDVKKCFFVIICNHLFVYFVKVILKSYNFEFFVLPFWGGPPTLLYYSLLCKVSLFIPFKKKGPSHHKELLYISWWQKLAVIYLRFSLVLQWFHKDGFTLFGILMILFCTILYNCWIHSWLDFCA